MKFASRRGTQPSRAKLVPLVGALVLAFACLAVPRLAVSAGQDRKQSNENRLDLKPFVGTWKASFKGEVFAVLVLTEKDGKLNGTLNNFDVSFDPEGNLADDTHKDIGDAPLLNIHFQSGALVFVVMEKDAYHPSATWKFVPTTAEEGELTLLPESQPDAPANSKIKPIRMFRDHAKP
jgi:hypothetical protein